MNEFQRQLIRSMDEYTELFSQLQPLYCVAVWTLDRENVYADAKVLARKATEEALNIKPLCIADYFFKHQSVADANLPTFFSVDPFTHTFYNVGIFFFMDSNDEDAHQLMRNKSSSRFSLNGEFLDEKRSSLKRPYIKLSQFSSQMYPQLVYLNPFPFCPLSYDEKPNHLTQWKLALLTIRLSLEAPVRFGTTSNYLGIGGGLPNEEVEKAITKLQRKLRPNFSSELPRVTVTQEDMASRLRLSGVEKPRECWPLKSPGGKLSWQSPMFVSVLRQDLLGQVLRIVREVAHSPTGLVSLPVDVEVTDNLFFKDDDGFHIKFNGGKQFVLKQSRGLEYIWIRLKYRRRAFSAEDLMSYGNGGYSSVSKHDALPNNVSEIMNENGDFSLDAVHSYEEFTEEDRRKGQKEVKRLEMELQSATAKRAAKIRSEIAFHCKHYGISKVGILGIRRTERTKSQKNREAVSKVIKAACDKIHQIDPGLALYLEPLSRYSKGKFDSDPAEINWIVD